MSGEILLKIDGVSIGYNIAHDEEPELSFDGHASVDKLPVADSKETSILLKEMGADSINIDIEIDKSTYNYPIKIIKRLYELRALYKGETVDIELVQNTGSSDESYSFEKCICTGIDSTSITNKAGAIFKFNFIYGGGSMKIEQLPNSTFLLPNGESYEQAKNWTHTPTGQTSKRVKLIDGSFGVLLYNDGFESPLIEQTVNSNSNASASDIVILNVEVERVDKTTDFYRQSVTAGSFVTGTVYTIDFIGIGASATDFTLIGADDNNIGTIFTATGAGTGDGTAHTAGDDWILTADVDDEVSVTLFITTGGSIVAKDPFSLSKNTPSCIIKTACELSVSSAHKFTIQLTGGAGAVLIKRAWLETRSSDEC